MWKFQPNKVGILRTSWKVWPERALLTHPETCIIASVLDWCLCNVTYCGLYNLISMKTSCAYSLCFRNCLDSPSIIVIISKPFLLVKYGGRRKCPNHERFRISQARERHVRLSESVHRSRPKFWMNTYNLLQFIQNVRKTRKHKISNICKVSLYNFWTSHEVMALMQCKADKSLCRQRGPFSFKFVT